MARAESAVVRRLRERIVELLAAGPEVASTMRRVLVGEGWSDGQIRTARDAIVTNYRATNGLFMWRLRPRARGLHDRLAPNRRRALTPPVKLANENTRTPRPVVCLRALQGADVERLRVVRGACSVTVRETCPRCATTGACGYRYSAIARRGYVHCRACCRVWSLFEFLALIVGAAIPQAGATGSTTAAAGSGLAVGR